jgi:hypothetical protein
MDPGDIENYLNKNGCEWVFNPPHASHAGGVWEIMIGISRNILNAMFGDIGTRQLTHEVLSTLMAEVSAIVNNRSLVRVSNDPSAPEILTPAIILSLKESPIRAAPGNFTKKDLHTHQWRQVQFLADKFWSRWRKEFLPTLQPRRKWKQESANLKEGDIVLLRNKEEVRNH